jgi:hypothetical protein
VEVGGEERHTSGPGRPSPKRPRVVKALRYGLTVPLHERTAGIASTMPELGWVVLLTHVPLEGAMAQSAREGLRAYKAQHGGEQHCAFLQDPVLVNRLCLKKPERMEALGLVLWLARLVWRLGERALRVPGETTGGTVTGWDKQATLQPTAFLMMTTFAAVLVLTGGPQRQLAQPWSAVPQAYRRARGVPATACTSSPQGEGKPEGKGQPLTHGAGASWESHGGTDRGAARHTPASRVHAPGTLRLCKGHTRGRRGQSGS